MSAASNSALAGFLPRLPVYLVWLAGIILALARWRRHPRASLLTIIAIAVFIVNAMVGALASLWLQRVAQASRVPWVNGPPIAARLMVISVVRTLLEAFLATAGFSLLIAAAFVSRRPRKMAASVPEPAKLALEGED